MVVRVRERRLDASLALLSPGPEPDGGEIEADEPGHESRHDRRADRTRQREVDRDPADAAHRGADDLRAQEERGRVGRPNAGAHEPGLERFLVLAGREEPTEGREERRDGIRRLLLELRPGGQGARAKIAKPRRDRIAVPYENLVDRDEADAERRCEKECRD
jgi:hypothetical protein